jgi:hypothetical protein
VPKASNNVETAAGGSGAGTTDIQGGVVQDPAKLNQGADARQATPKPAASQTQGEAIPSNHDADIKKARELQAKRAKKYKKKKGQKPEVQAPAPASASEPAAQTQPTSTPSDAQQPNLQAPSPSQAAPQQSGPQQ